MLTYGRYHSYDYACWLCLLQLVCIKALHLHMLACVEVRVTCFRRGCCMPGFSYVDDDDDYDGGADGVGAARARIHVVPYAYVLSTSTNALDCVVYQQRLFP